MAGNYWKSSHFQEWTLTREDLVRSRRADLSLLSENEYEKIFIFFSHVIHMLAEQLGVPQVMGIATVYFKRFYAINSLRCIDPLLLAPTCVYLASKVDALEHSGIIRPQKLMLTCQKVVKNHLNHAYSEEFPYCMADIVECEFCLLENLEFSLVVYQPFRQLLDLVQQFGLDDQLQALAMYLVKSSFETDVCLLHTPRQVAAGCLWIAVEKLQREITSSFGELDEDWTKIEEVISLQHDLETILKNFDETREIKGILEKIPKPRMRPEPDEG